MPRAEKCIHPGKNVSEPIVGVLETPVTEVQNFCRAMRKVRLRIEGYDQRPSQVACTGTQLQPIMWQGENFLEVTASDASKFVRRVGENIFTLKKLKTQICEPEKREGMSAEVVRREGEVA